MPALIVAAVTFLLMWVLFILPQQRRLKAHRAFVASLQVGDEVITTSGMLGTIVAVDDDEVGLEVAHGVVVRFARAAMAARPADAEVVAAVDVAADVAPPVPTATAADRALDPPVVDEPAEK